MILSSACVYAVRAMVHLASTAGEERVSIGDMARELGLSFHFLTKTLQLLTADGLLESERGPRGGVRLARAPSEISLIDIIRSVDGHELFEGCVLGLPGCGRKKPCPMHDAWVRERDRLRGLFERNTLQRLARATNQGSLRLTEI